MEPERKPNTALATFIVLVIVGAVATGVLVFTKDDEQTATTTEPNTTASREDTADETTAEETPATEVETTSAFEDGSYDAEGRYSTPGGTESIDVELTLEDDVVTDITVTQNATSGNAAEFQSKFVSGYKSQVVGKKIDEVELSHVAGSSLTPNGFNDAIEQIRQDAQI